MWLAHAADIERLKVVSPLDAADIGHRAEDRREQASEPKFEAGRSIQARLPTEPDFADVIPNPCQPV
jgi:hypothetical protein